MKVTTKFRYGLRAMIDLAMQDGSKPVLAQEIADRQQVSRKYLDHILSSLKSSGLVRSVRGSKGGYLLAKPAGEIDAAEIGLALEGDLDVVDCIIDPTTCPRKDLCPTHDLWEEVGNGIVETLRSWTLERLVGIAKKRQASTTPMYYI